MALKNVSSDPIEGPGGTIAPGETVPTPPKHLIDRHPRFDSARRAIDDGRLVEVKKDS